VAYRDSFGSRAVRCRRGTTAARGARGGCHSRHHTRWILPSKLLHRQSIRMADLWNRRTRVAARVLGTGGGILARGMRRLTRDTDPMHRTLDVAAGCASRTACSHSRWAVAGAIPSRARLRAGDQERGFAGSHAPHRVRRGTRRAAHRPRSYFDRLVLRSVLGGGDFEPPRHGRVSVTFYSKFWRVFKSGIFALRGEVAMESWSRSAFAASTPPVCSWG